ncbi:hypothetical protein GCM10007320_10820 [Pseudorhodoferax aquiterrae]|uniref:Uncharacterized protein n=1 Tax=Pseudorhodoferax aquiterrae TaxID=747304 RepID=A0ABQ3FXM6_9BURK|nr:hypothetical protein [Pseudorhodoferax aquiterrae]GHC74053.1 hypothetical protein GCM10007320_10820 [Pseudorhodoferax aquiterrae]
MEPEDDNEIVKIQAENLDDFERKLLNYIKDKSRYFVSDIEKQLSQRAIGFDNNDNDILKGMRKTGGDLLRGPPSTRCATRLCDEMSFKNIHLRQNGVAVDRAKCAAASIL